ncbi:hypothetical protein B7Y94_01690 [Candidatus Saccharibacteria bacterium 32-49-12]|nr:MAG: hypothetical protein B7Y94_01690 [Candidatus Saccharibacteria bacterium 32-49-12]
MTKILLVEDDKSLREIYGVRLLAEGYDIVSAGDGEEALAMAIKERPALIVSDVMMPKISGFDMLDILRSTTETKDIKVIMMTALSSEDQRQRGERLGADRYLVKSQVGIEDVVRTVHEVLGDLPSMAHGSAAPPVQAAPQQFTAPSQSRPAQEPAAPTTLPQPTAPFSSSPRPTNLGDRVIQPIQQSQSQEDVARRIEEELALDSSSPQPQQPQPQSAPVSIPVSQPLPQPAPQAPAPQPAPPQPQALGGNQQPPVTQTQTSGMPTAPGPSPSPMTSGTPPAPMQPQPPQPINRPDIASLSPQQPQPFAAPPDQTANS